MVKEEDQEFKTSLPYIPSFKPLGLHEVLSQQSEDGSSRRGRGGSGHGDKRWFCLLWKTTAKMTKIPVLLTEEMSLPLSSRDLLLFLPPQAAKC